MSEPLLSVTALSASYGPVAVLHELSLTVRKGEIVTVIGANGAGKTTLLLALSGLVSPSSGSIRFKGEEISGLPAHERVRRGLAQVPEGRKIFPRLTVRENLELGAFLHPWDQTSEAILSRVYTLFPVLKQRQSQAGGTLSGGEQQMLAIGRALMSRPTMLLLDEPSMGVAPLLTARIFETLAELNRGGLTVLLVEQNAHLALGLAHRGYVIETGRVVLEDRGEALRADARVREAYLGE